MRDEKKKERNIKISTKCTFINNTVLNLNKFLMILNVAVKPFEILC